MECRCPASNLDDLVGKLIVIEGTDGVGRSTQIRLLKEWLEQQGHAVLDTGLTRSGLVGKEHQARQGRPYPGPHHAEPFLRHRFRRPAGKRDRAGAARRIRGAHRPLYLFADGARDGAGARSHLGAQHSPLRAQARRHFLSAHRRGRADSPRRVYPRLRLLGVRHGPLLDRGHVRQLPKVSDRAAGAVRPSGGGVSFRRDRRAARASRLFSSSSRQASIASWRHRRSGPWLPRQRKRRCPSRNWRSRRPRKNSADELSES